MIHLIKTLVRKLASAFGIGDPDPAFLFDESNFQHCFGSTAVEVSRRGTIAIVRSYRDCTYQVVDIMAEGGPELVGEYAIYRNAVRAAEQRNQRNQGLNRQGLLRDARPL